MNPGSGLRYGFMGLPLAMAGLPVYIQVAPRYAGTDGLSLSLLGSILLATRIVDALADPVIGRRVDGWRGDAGRAWRGSVAATLVLAVAFAALWFPPAGLAVPWLVATLLGTSLALSTLVVWHASLGVGLARSESARGRVVAWREGFGLLGVLIATVLAGSAGPVALAAAAALALVPGWWGLWQLQGAAGPVAAVAVAAGQDPWQVWRHPAFRGLWRIQMANATASAVAATVLPFFVADFLGAASWLPWCFAAYFIAGALSLPLWLRAVQRHGLAASWSAGMLLGLGMFVWVLACPAGSAAGRWGFLALCAGSGLALGADLACPAALLMGLCQRAPAALPEGSAFGWWTFATKASLALAAGVALPLLEALGYRPGAPAGTVLVAVYAGLPLLLRAAAWLGLCAWRRRHGDTPARRHPPSRHPLEALS